MRSPPRPCPGAHAKRTTPSGSASPLHRRRLQTSLCGGKKEVRLQGRRAHQQAHQRALAGFSPRRAPHHPVAQPPAGGGGGLSLRGAVSLSVVQPPLASQSSRDGWKSRAPVCGAPRPLEVTYTRRRVGQGKVGTGTSAAMSGHSSALTATSQRPG